jgi:hypothetical protein
MFSYAKLRGYLIMKIPEPPLAPAELEPPAPPPPPVFGVPATAV